jgi:hypothetical protein
MTTTTEVNMTTLSAAIAAQLGAGWSVRAVDAEDHDVWSRHWSHLDGPGGAALTLSHRDGRLHVSADWPRDRESGSSEDYGPSRYTEAGRALRAGISADPKRDPIALARDISRRVLARYLPELPAAFARLAEDRQRKADQLDTARTVAALVGGKLTERDLEQQRRGGTVQLYSPLQTVYRVSVDYGGTVALELHGLTVETLRRIMAAVQDQAAPAEEEDPEDHVCDESRSTGRCRCLAADR